MVILSKCTYHNQLTRDITKVEGGGMFKYDSKTKTFTLYGESHQFGAVDLVELARIIKAGLVFKRHGSPLVGFRYVFDTGTEIIDLDVIPKSKPVKLPNLDK